MYVCIIGLFRQSAIAVHQFVLLFVWKKAKEYHEFVTSLLKQQPFTSFLHQYFVFFVFLLKGNNLSSIHSRIKKQKKLKTRKLRKINSKTTRLTSLLLVGDIELSPVSYSLLSLLLSVFFLLTASFN